MNSLADPLQLSERRMPNQVNTLEDILGPYNGLIDSDGLIRIQDSVLRMSVEEIEYLISERAITCVSINTTRMLQMFVFLNQVTLLRDDVNFDVFEVFLNAIPKLNGHSQLAQDRIEKIKQKAVTDILIPYAFKGNLNISDPRINFNRVFQYFEMFKDNNEFTLMNIFNMYIEYKPTNISIKRISQLNKEETIIENKKEEIEDMEFTRYLIENNLIDPETGQVLPIAA